jgi:Ca-activated chloride channel family protein
MRLLRLPVVTPLLIAASIGAQAPSPALRIVSPAEGDYVIGPVRIVAVIEPAASARDVTRVAFFADGRQVCATARPPYECEWYAGDRVTEHLFRVVATLRNGSQLVQNVRTRSLTVTETVDVDVIQVTAVVTDGDGRFIRGLTKKDFRVFDNGQLQPISDFAAENIPLELVSVIDVSSSMRDSIGVVKDAAKRFLTGIAPADQVTVLAFNENIFPLARRATDHAARTRAVDRMEAWGGTALYDAIIQAIEILGRQSGRRAIVLFSDGDDQSSHAALDDAIRATEGSDATIYAIGQGRAVSAPALQKLLRQISTVSGGRAFFSNDPQRLDSVFTEILEDLRNQYLISYPAPDSQRNDDWHTIKLEVAGGKYGVRARSRYRLSQD